MSESCPRGADEPSVSKACAMRRIATLQPIRAAASGPTAFEWARRACPNSRSSQRATLFANREEQPASSQRMLCLAMKSAQAFPALHLAMGLLAVCACAPPTPARSTPIQTSASLPSTPTPTPVSSAVTPAPSSTAAAATASAPVQPLEAPTRSKPEAAYTTPLLDGPTLTRTIQATCRAAVSERRPILLEFSAPWCADCLALEQLKQAPALASELSLATLADQRRQRR